jgi:hypothetical protein
LLAGDLKGRLKMARSEIAPQQPVLDPWYEAGRLIKELNTRKLLPAGLECMRLLFERAGTAS